MEKHLSLEEAQKRIPENNSKITGFENGKYKIQTVDGFIYFKAVNKLHQGDPRNKCGKTLTIDEVKNKLLKYGYELIIESYTIKRNPLQAKCLKCGYIRQNRLDGFTKQPNCPKCSQERKPNDQVNKFQKRLTNEDQTKILEFHSQGLTDLEISEKLNFSNSTIRNFLKKLNLESNVKIFDHSRPCIICGKVFTPKNTDGPAKSRYKTCSPECTHKLLLTCNIKYSEDQIKQVIDLKKKFTPNHKISEITNVNVNKIKEITKDNNLYLTLEQAQSNALEGLKEKGLHNSLAQKEVFDFVCSFNKFSNVKYDDRTVIPPKEIDIYIPELKLGIEYCGLVWHSDGFKENDYHYNKLKSVNEKGIRLITIFEDEWIYRKDQVKNFLKSTLGIYNKKIPARKCEVKELNKGMAEKFIDDYHIQKSSSIKIAFGLYYQEELVGVISAEEYFRNNEQFDNYLSLNRLIFKDGYQIMGGASKLVKSLENYAKANNFSGIITWSDNRWSEGNVYIKCGFELVGKLDIDYSYTYGNCRYSKQSCTKEKLLKKGAIGNTELEMAQSLGYFRIYDCGKKRWAIKLS